MITRNELLTKLAIECATWDEANSIAVHSKCLKDNQQEGCPGFSKEEWIAERERLLNKPDWPDAKELKWRAMDEGGLYCFFSVMPVATPHCNEWLFGEKDVECLLLESIKAIAIPEGYDWRKSLEERTK